MKQKTSDEVISRKLVESGVLTKEQAYEIMKLPLEKEVNNVSAKRV